MPPAQQTTRTAAPPDGAPLPPEPSPAGPAPTGPALTGAVLPSSVLLWDAAEVADPPRSACCLRGTAAGDRAVVYRTGPGGGVVALVEFTSDAVTGPDSGRHADCAVVAVGSVPRAELLADAQLAPVFRSLRGRRRLPPAAARRLVALLGSHP